LRLPSTSLSTVLRRRRVFWVSMLMMPTPSNIAVVSFDSTSFFCEGEIILKQEHNTSPKFYTQDPKEKESYRLVPGSHVHLLLQPLPPLPPSVATTGTKLPLHAVMDPQT
jgi:hypothetical protein